MRPSARYCEGLCPSHSPVWSPRIPLTFWSWIGGGAQVCSRWGHDSASWCRAAFLVVHQHSKTPLPAVLTAVQHQSSHRQLHPAVHPMVVQGGHQWGHDFAGWCRTGLFGDAPLNQKHPCQPVLMPASPIFPPITPPGKPPRWPNYIRRFIPGAKGAVAN